MRYYEFPALPALTSEQPVSCVTHLALQLTLQLVLNRVEIPPGLDEQTYLHPPILLDERFGALFPWAEQSSGSVSLI